MTHLKFNISKMPEGTQIREIAQNVDTGNIDLNGHTGKKLSEPIRFNKNQVSQTIEGVEEMHMFQRGIVTSFINGELSYKEAKAYTQQIGKDFEMRLKEYQKKYPDIYETVMQDKTLVAHSGIRGEIEHLVDLRNSNRIALQYFEEHKEPASGFQKIINKLYPPDDFGEIAKVQGYTL